MSGIRVRSMNNYPENKVRSPTPTNPKKQFSPEGQKEEKERESNAGGAGSNKPTTLSPPERKMSAPAAILRSHGSLLRRNLSLNASCSSDASSDASSSVHSRASTGRICSGGGGSGGSRGGGKRRVGSKLVERSENGVHDGNQGLGMMVGGVKKRCAWVTNNSEDPLYATFHDEEWGVPVHDDKILFELLTFALALAELSWPTILNKRNTFREVLLDFDPVSVAKINEKKISAPGSPGSSLLSEMKLRNIIENARQVCKIVEEFGSFDKYIWSFTNHKPLVNKFRYPRQVPVKTPKADVISKDLVRRGLRGVGPTVVYSFMQAAGITNDHLVTCFRFQECVAASEGVLKADLKTKSEEEKPDDIVKLELAIALDDISICSD